MTSVSAGSKVINSVKPRVHEALYNRIIDRIRTGDLTPGDKLASERDLALEFGIGRPAVREALRSLQASGVLRFEKGQNGGAFIREEGADGLVSSIRHLLILGRMPLSDLTEVRAALMSEAARLAAIRGQVDDFDAIERNIDLIEAMARTGDVFGTIAPISESYRLVGRASHNPMMSMLIDAMAEVVNETLIRLKIPTGVMDYITPRRDMLAAMRARDPAAAEGAIRRHLEESSSLFVEQQGAS